MAMFTQLKMPKGFLVAMGLIIGTVPGALVGLWIAIGIVVGAAAEFTVAKTASSE